MERLVLDEKAPLYGMAQRIGLGELPLTEVIAFLRARAGTGRKAMTEEAAELIVDTAGPVPNDIQHLAYEAYDAAADEVDIEALCDGFCGSAMGSTTKPRSTATDTRAGRPTSVGFSWSCPSREGPDRRPRQPSPLPLGLPLGRRRAKRCRP